MTTAVGDDRAAERRRLRATRRSLSVAERSAAAAGVAANLTRLGLPTPGSRVAAYLPMDGELDPAPAISLVRSRGCKVYVPAVTSFHARHMRFRLLSSTARTHRNRWGIHQPEGIGINGRWLDLVLVPCVAFDVEGGRLGMGAGFYDRHFAFLRHRRAWRRPRLLGLAYDWQRLSGIGSLHWDVPLWGIVTERQVYGHAARLLRPAIGEIPE